MVDGSGWDEMLLGAYGERETGNEMNGSDVFGKMKDGEERRCVRRSVCADSRCGGMSVLLWPYSMEYAVSQDLRLLQTRSVLRAGLLSSIHVLSHFPFH